MKVEELKKKIYLVMDALKAHFYGGLMQTELEGFTGLPRVELHYILRHLIQQKYAIRLFRDGRWKYYMGR